MGLVPQGDLDAMVALMNEASANATLTTVTGPGAPDRTGDPGAGAVLWSGLARGFLSRERHDEVGGGAQVPVKLDTFTLLDGVAPVVAAAGPDWEATTVTIVDERIPASPVTLVFTVTGLEHDAHGLLDSVLLTLDEVGV